MLIRQNFSQQCLILFMLKDFDYIHHNSVKLQIYLLLLYDSLLLFLLFPFSDSCCSSSNRKKHELKTPLMHIYVIILPITSHIKRRTLLTGSAHSTWLCGLVQWITMETTWLQAFVFPHGRTLLKMSNINSSGRIFKQFFPQDNARRTLLK